MADFDASELATVAKQAAEAGGQELMEWRKRFTKREKGPRDFVTDADEASQVVIRAILAERFPHHQFVGEESVDSNDAPDPGQVCWVVDPLDGTTNYVHDFPAFAVSIAAVTGGRAVAGAIFDPVRGEMFWAALGGGAWLGDERVKVGDAQRLADALVAISLPASVGAESPDLRDLVRLAPHCRAIRRIGSAALNLAYVAGGRLDAYWARQIHPWDIAAGALLVEEAGGVVTDDRGGPFNVWNPPFAASGGDALHRELLSYLA